MFNTGFIASNLEGVQELPVPAGIHLPPSYNMAGQLPDKPWDQGDSNICVSVCVTDMCKYVFQEKGRKYVREVGYFFNSRKDRTQKGMSPREALDKAMSDNLIKSYAFLRSIDSIKYSILSNGPVLIVLPVYSTVATDFWQPEGELQGYHAVTLVGYGTTCFTLRNSWGSSYGSGGYAVFSNIDIGQIKEAWTVFN
jgi:hypothetical protein